MVGVNAVTRCLLFNLSDDLPDDEFVQLVGQNDQRIGKTGLIQHLGCLNTEIRQVTRVQSNTYRFVPLTPQSLKDPDRVGNAAFQRVNRVNQ